GLVTRPLCELQSASHDRPRIQIQGHRSPPRHNGSPLCNISLSDTPLSFSSRWVVRSAMVGELITLPVRIGVRAAALWLRAVEELAEPGAEEGAGAEFHVEQPWDEYESMNAKDIIARLPRCDAAQLAAVTLYERGHRARHTVLAAVEREMRANGAAPQIEKER